MSKKNTTAEGSLASRLAGLARVADDVNRKARAERYRFGTQSLAECHCLEEWLKFLGAGRRDTLYMALLEHIVEREAREARGKVAARRRAREKHG